MSQDFTSTHTYGLIELSWQWYRYKSEALTSPVVSLQWRHNGRDSVSNHQPRECLLSRLIRRRSKKTSKLRVTGLCAGNSPGPVNSPHKGPVTRKMFLFDDVIMGLPGSVFDVAGMWHHGHPVQCSGACPPPLHSPRLSHPPQVHTRSNSRPNCYHFRSLQSATQSFIVIFTSFVHSTNNEVRFKEVLLISLVLWHRPELKGLVLRPLRSA